MLEPLGDLTPETSIKAGIAADTSKEPVKPKLSKALTSADLEAFGDRVAEANSSEVKEAVAASSAIIVKLTNDTTLFKSIRQKLLVEQGLTLIDEDICPLCDNAWDAKELRAHLRDKLTRATEAAAAMERA